MQKFPALAAALIAAGCAKPPEAPPADRAPASAIQTSAPQTHEVVASGKVEWPPGVALPQNAVLRVTLSDVSRQDAASAPLAEQTYSVDAGPPVAFLLTAQGDIDPRARLSVSARISDGAALLYVSDTYNPVSATDGASDLSLTLVAVEAAPGTGAGGAPVTPSPVAYDCGPERLAIAIEAGAAYVTGADGETARLDKIAGGSAAPQTFTNGRMTVIFDGSDMNGLNLRFARGKAAAIACVAAQ